MQTLIAAKDPRDRRVLQRRLHDVGYCPTASLARGRETLVYIQHHEIDVILARRRLQDMEAPSLARAMELQGKDDVSTIMICDSIRRDELLDALDQGIDHVLVRPFTRAELKAKISRLSTRPRVAPRQREGGTVFGKEPEKGSVPASLDRAVPAY